MSNFKERQASAKKVIQLQNEILSLKQQLSNAAPSKDSICEECEALRAEIEKTLLATAADCEAYLQQISTLKAELKKVKSENTRLKKKLKASTSEES